MDGARERGEGGSERSIEGATERRRGAWEEGREGNFKGGILRRTLASIQRTKQDPTWSHTIATSVLQIQNCNGYINSVL